MRRGLLLELLCKFQHDTYIEPCFTSLFLLSSFGADISEIYKCELNDLNGTPLHYFVLKLVLNDAQTSINWIILQNWIALNAYCNWNFFVDR